MRACPRHRVQSCQGEPSDWSIQPLHVPRNRESRNGGVYSRIGEYLHWVSMREEAIYEISVGCGSREKDSRSLQEILFLSFGLSVYLSFFLSIFLSFWVITLCTTQVLPPFSMDMGLCGQRFSIQVDVFIMYYSFLSCSYPKEWDWDYGGRDDASIGATVGS